MSRWDWIGLKECVVTGCFVLRCLGVTKSRDR